MVSVTLCLLGLLAICQYGESAVTWTTPSGGNGALATAAPEQDVTSVTDLTGLTVTAVSAGQAIVSYALTTNPGSIFAETGTTVAQLQIAANKGLDYEFQSSYVLVIEATDDTSGTALTGTATVTVSVSDVTTDPTFSAPYLCAVLADHSPVGATVTTLSATYSGSSTLTYVPNPTTHFEISSAGVVTVKTGVTIDRATTPSYAATLTLHDGSFTSTALFNVCVGSSSECGACGASTSGASGVTFKCMALLTLLLLLVV